MKKLLVLLWCLMVLPLGMKGVYAVENPTVTYDGNRHVFTVENTDGHDFFNGFKNVIPGDTKVQIIDLNYENVSQDLSVYLRADCDDQEMLNLLKDTTMDIYMDHQLISDDQWIFDSIHLGNIEDSTSQQMEVQLHIPTSLGNEIAGKSVHLQWVLTVQEEEPVQGSSEVSRPQHNPNDRGNANTVETSTNQGDAMAMNGQVSSQEGTPLEGSLDDDSSYSTIIDEQVPQAGHSGSWALLNLIAVILTVILAILMFIRKQTKEKEDEDNVTEMKRRRWIPIVGVVIAIVSIIVFILTEDITLKMVYVDSYTIWMIVLAVINIVLLILGRTWKEVKNDNQ